jgi:hypothetical protein
LVTGLLLTGLAGTRLTYDPDTALNQTKIAVKSVTALIIFIAAVVAYRKQTKMTSGDNERSLLPLLHSAGALAVTNTIIGVVWSGVVS